MSVTSTTSNSAARTPPATNSMATITTSSSTDLKSPYPDVLWLVPPDDGLFERYERPESFFEKGMRKTKQNPFVPVGILLTCGALCTGLYSMVKGDSHLSQMAMRGRVLFQGLTVAVLVGGIALASKKPTVTTAPAAYTAPSTTKAFSPQATKNA